MEVRQPISNSKHESKLTLGEECLPDLGGGSFLMLESMHDWL